MLFGAFSDSLNIVFPHLFLILGYYFVHCPQEVRTFRTVAIAFSASLNPAITFWTCVTLDMGLAGPVPTEVGQLTLLTYLSLGNNNLSGMWLCVRLAQLKVQWCLVLLRICPKYFPYLVLICITLCVELAGPIPTEVGQLNQLQALWLRGNKLARMWRHSFFFGSEPVSLWAINRAVLLSNFLVSGPSSGFLYSFAHHVFWNCG